MAWPKGKPRKPVTTKATVTDPVEANALQAVASASEPATHEALQEPEYTPITLGKMADALLSNPAVDEAFRRRITEIVSAWENTELTDTAEREALWHRIRALRDLKTELTRIGRAGGSVARKQDRGLRVA